MLQVVGSMRHSIKVDGKRKNVHYLITFKDSYAIITKPLKLFPSMFQLDSGRKEVFQYNYYNSTNTKHLYGSFNEALEHIPTNEHQIFLSNLQELQ